MNHTNKEFVAECEPHFFDALSVAAEYARRVQDSIKELVEGRKSDLADALGLSPDELSLVDYWHPGRFQDVDPEDSIWIGLKLRGPSSLQIGFSRYWEAEENGVGVWILTRPRASMDALAKALQSEDGSPSQRKDKNYSDSLESDGYYLYRTLSRDENINFEQPFEDLIESYIRLLSSIGGVRNFLNTQPLP